MSNRTTATESLLLGFSDVWELQILHFVVFLVIYLAALVGNLLILNNHLQTPMYFFLMNLSILDLGSISVTIPKSMANYILNTRSISYAGCVAQVFLFVFFTEADFAFLTVMAYDRYVAICKPLHYETAMNRRACVQMAASAWISGILYSVLHTGNTFALTFCGGNMVDQFFCEISQLLKLACSGSYLSEIGLVITIVAALFTLLPFALTVTSYVCIISTTLKIPSTSERQKVFSTCSSHLIVVTIFYGTLIIVYLLPKTNTLRDLNKVFSVFYTILTPMANPFIYSLRNKEVKEALRKIVSKCIDFIRIQKCYCIF
uniref:Olfactory receptor n=1 Tax=Gopherus agassizii TaxID=38772 RepID=A0A452H4M7_9SAUR